MTGLRTIELTDGGILLYDEAFLPSELADRYFMELRDKCVWEQKPGIFGHMQPRLTASYGDAGCSCRRTGFVISPLHEGQEHFSGASSWTENLGESILSSTNWPGLMCRLMTSGGT